MMTVSIARSVDALVVALVAVEAVVVAAWAWAVERPWLLTCA